MKKLNILKAIIDFIWIIAVPITAPLIIFFSVFILIRGDIDIDYGVLGFSTNLSSLYARLLIVILCLCLLLMIYSLHLFKKVLRYFKQIKIFDDFVIQSFHKIGILLVASGTVSLLIGFFGKLFFESRLEVSLSFYPYLLIVGLGLFFQILSEIFTIAKKAKQENDLTI